MKNHERSVEQLAACLVMEARHADLEKLFRNGGAGYGNTPQVRYLHAVALAKTGKTEEARAVLKELVGCDTCPEGVRKLYVELCFDKLAVMRDRIDQVGDLLTDLLTVAHDVPEYRERLTVVSNALPIASIRAGKRREAVEYWERQLDKGAFDPRSVHNLAVLYYWWIASLDGTHAAAVPPGDGSDALWYNFIGYWTVLLNSNEFWNAWKSKEEQNWKTAVSDTDVEAVKTQVENELLRNRILSIIDREKQEPGRRTNIPRYQRYLAALSLERKTGRLWMHAKSVCERMINRKIPNGMRQYELVRGLQTATETVPCYGTEERCGKSCPWAPDCFSLRNRMLSIDIPAGSFYYRNRRLDGEIARIAAILQAHYPDDHDLAEFRVYTESMELGLILECAGEANAHDAAADLFRRLPQEKRQSACGRYVHARMLMAAAIGKLRENGITEALHLWKQAMENASKTADESGNAPDLGVLFAAVVEEIGKAVENACDGSSNVPEEKAIPMLETALSIVKSEKIKSTLAVHYVNKGRSENQKEHFDEARTWFEKALGLVSGLESAREGISISYNNQATTEKDDDRAIRYFRKAMEYMTGQDETILRNYAGRLNGKAVGILNSVSEYNLRSKRYELDEALRMLKEALKVVNPLCRMQLTKPDELIGEMHLVDQYVIDGLVKKLDDELLQLLVRHLYLAKKYRSFI